jgi:hypothetical protein
MFDDHYNQESYIAIRAYGSQDVLSNGCVVKSYWYNYCGITSLAILLGQAAISGISTFVGSWTIHHISGLRR